MQLWHQYGQRQTQNDLANFRRRTSCRKIPFEELQKLLAKNPPPEELLAKNFL